MSLEWETKLFAHFPLPFLPIFSCALKIPFHWIKTIPATALQKHLQIPPDLRVGLSKLWVVCLGDFRVLEVLNLAMKIWYSAEVLNITALRTSRSSCHFRLLTLGLHTHIWKCSPVSYLIHLSNWMNYSECPSSLPAVDFTIRLFSNI